MKIVRQISIVQVCWPLRALSLLLLGCLVTLPSETARAGEESTSGEVRPVPYRYFNPDGIGAHAFYDPINIIIAGGFGALYNRQLHTFDFREGLDQVAYSLRHPLKTIDDYGWMHFLDHEFVLGNGPGASPNYTWHLIGGGFRNVLLEEYFIHHGYQTPKLNAWVTSYSYHLINELIQAEKYTKGSTDALADLLVFDLLGKLLFELEVVNNLAQALHLTDWTFQTQWNPRTNRLINNGQLLWVRWQIWDPISIGVTSGELLNTLNLTYTHRQHHQFTAGFGLQARDIFLNNLGESNATTGLNLGLYYSVDDNPMVVVMILPEDPRNTPYKNSGEINRRNYAYSRKYTLNVYPGWFSFDGFRPGLTVSWQKDTLLIGMGAGQWPLGFVFSANDHPKYRDDD